MPTVRLHFRLVCLQCFSCLTFFIMTSCVLLFILSIGSFIGFGIALAAMYNRDFIIDKCVMVDPHHRCEWRGGGNRHCYALISVKSRRKSSKFHKVVNQVPLDCTKGTGCPYEKGEEFTCYPSTRSITTISYDNPAILNEKLITGLIVCGCGAFLFFVCLIPTCMCGAALGHYAYPNTVETPVGVRLRKQTCEAHFSRLPKHVITQNEDPLCQVQCTICLETFRIGDECVELPSCKHTFHGECIKGWFLSGPHISCPNCRNESIFFENVPQPANSSTIGPVPPSLNRRI